jgi:hypothetical protein
LEVEQEGLKVKQEKWVEENVSWKKSMRLKSETGEAGRRE